MLAHADTALHRWIDARARERAMLLALDFDGTLAPIVPRPSAARMPAATRAALETLAARTDTRVAIMSGRALDDIQTRVGLPDLIYAGNHGLEIRGPGVERTNVEAAAARPAIQECLRRLEATLGAEDGVLLEDKGLTLSVHYRLVPSETLRAAIPERVRRACEDVPGIRFTHGKRVVEVRPAIDWGKGRAVRFLIDTLLETSGSPVLFIGDDETDEDAFLALAGRGDGIIVADPVPASTAASFFLNSPDDVADLLRRLAHDGTG